MSGSRRPKSDEDLEVDPSDDLEDDPGIGRSKGGFAMTDEPPIERDTTFEGDVFSDATPQGVVDPKQTDRTNE